MGEERAADVIYPGFSKAFDMGPPQYPSFQIRKVWIWSVVCWMDKKLVERLYPESASQWLDVQMEISDQWCLSGVSIGADDL